MRTTLAVTVVLLVLGGSALAQDDSIAKFNELEAIGKTKQQADLDTFKLASAHREQARSIDEKTNGLFRSWVVSICQGCGADLRPAKELKAKDFPNRDVSMTTVTLEPSKKPDASKQSAVPKPRKQPHVNVAADLSAKNVDVIREKPRE